MNPYNHSEGRRKLEKIDKKIRQVENKLSLGSPTELQAEALNKELKSLKNTKEQLEEKYS